MITTIGTQRENTLPTKSFYYKIRVKRSEEFNEKGR